MQDPTTENLVPNQPSEELSNARSTEEPLTEVIKINPSIKQGALKTEEEGILEEKETILEQQEAIPESLEFVKDWFTAAQKLHQQNKYLTETIAGLEQELAATQEQLQSQIIQSRTKELLISKQKEEFNLSQEETSRLLKEIESDREVIRRQQNNLDSLSQELKASQELVSQLQRQCSRIQESEQEKAERILQLERQERELKARLTRQQRHSLQFKAALDRCLQVPGYISQGKDSGKTEPVPLPNITISSNSPIPKVQPIQPWSSELDPLADSSTEDDGETLEKHSNSCEPKAEPQTNTDIDAWEQTKLVEEILLEVNNSKSPEKISSGSNWPAPIINGLGTGKKRKSRAEIDLPAFEPPKTTD